MDAEIYGPDNTVHYRRWHRHEMIAEALRTEGYWVFLPNCRDMRILDELPCDMSKGYPVSFVDGGIKIEAVK